MPELPEVETMCRGIAPIVGRRVTCVERALCSRRPIAIRPRIDAFQRRANGKMITAVERVGKRVVIWLEATASGQPRGGDAIVIEPRMTGLVLLADPPTREHLRFRMNLTTGPRTRGPSNRVVRELLFWDRRGLGSISLLSASAFAERFSANGSTLGPDALRLSSDQLRERLRGSRRAIKVALLDQRSLAGVGNLYASEILHSAGIHPMARCNRIRSADWPRIHHAMRTVLEQAIRYEGSTLADGTYRNALNQAGGFQNHHRVYDRAGEPCLSCGSAAVRRIVQAQRSTFFCPKCQRT